MQYGVGLAFPVAVFSFLLAGLIAANGATFQQDNARPHIARANMDFLHQNSVDVLPLPALSPELSPIEHFWNQLDRQ
jgi:transposase